MTRANVAFCNNTDADLRPFHRDLIKALHNDGHLPEELADTFTMKVLEGFNPDGSDRGVINWA